MDYFGNVERYPAYREEDIDDLIRYYLLTGQTPSYYEFKDRNKYDVSVIAQAIIDNDFGAKAEDRFITEKWEEEKGGWQTFFDFTPKTFRNEITLAKARILHPEDFEIKHEKPQEIFEDRQYEDMTLAQIREVNPEYEKRLRNRVFEKFTDEQGFYHSAEGNYKSRNRVDFEIDHIKPMSAGGKTVFENLQLLTWWANRKKGDKWDDGKKKL